MASGTLIGETASQTTAPLVRYEPRGAALELLRCRDYEVLIEGPAGTGKTRALWTKIHLRCCKVPMRVLCLMSTRTAFNRTVLPLFETHVLLRNPAIVGDLSMEHRESYTYPNGSQIVLGGLDNSEKYLGGEYDAAVVFEATRGLDERAWGQILTRLRGPIGRRDVIGYFQGICECNPADETHWLNHRPGRVDNDPESPRRGQPMMRRLRSRHEDNPSVTPEYLATLRALPEPDRSRLYEGRWVGDTSGTAVFDGQIIGWLRDQARALSAVRPEAVRGSLVALDAVI